MSTPSGSTPSSSSDAGATALFAFRVAPEHLERAHGVITETLRATRAFDGCQSVEVLTHEGDPTRFVLLERWASPAADAAYRAWRATPEGASPLRDILAEPPTSTLLTTAEGV